METFPYNLYLDYLRKSASIPSVFTNHVAISNHAQFCLSILRENLPDWTTFQDVAGNIIAYDGKEDSETPKIYLSAHLDTVAADPAKWTVGKGPFSVYETAEHITARGVNDCKAGVAFMLWLSSLIRNGEISSKGIVFLFSFREEGNRWKTSNWIAKNLSKTIPLSSFSNSIICLENTVSYQSNGTHILSLFDREPCNLFINIIGNLSELRAFLQTKEYWRPVFIEPWSSYDPFGRINLVNDQPEGGHSASIQNHQNPLYRTIMSGLADDNVVFAGVDGQSSSIPTEVKVQKARATVDHKLMINGRSTLDVETLLSELKGVKYEIAYPLRYASGSDRSAHPPTRELIKTLKSASGQALRLVVEKNPGRSDASVFWNRMTSQQRAITGVVVAGPGTRSHKLNDGIPRRTHGANESYHKEAGKAACHVLLKAITNLQEA